MQCLVLVSGDLLEDPSKTIVKHVIEIMLFAIVLPFFALTCIAMMVMGCAGIVYTCKDLCENESDIEQV
ncbi:hypothetical protein PRIPAC_85656 [Pristionchus pacificus]|nr:hypothetical protein PRIPAC_85656 [Pristionchus pacificus]|eukprot:PDM68782.1 hypothetical protein PRIPAC_47084 [Pristionchus pacificus]